jgi:tRNA threonylcarbamoyladenosine modification (KEOPS) complex  Pcc1 subunit
MAGKMRGVHCRLEFTYPDEDTARKVLKAVELENYPYVEARVEGSTLVSEARADTVDSLVHTLEDYLACISVAEKMLDRS